MGVRDCRVDGLVWLGMVGMVMETCTLFSDLFYYCSVLGLCNMLYSNLSSECVTRDMVFCHGPRPAIVFYVCCISVDRLSFIHDSISYLLISQATEFRLDRSPPFEIPLTAKPATPSSLRFS